ncbi:MAG: hypothetical protein U1C46_07685 [Bacteroidales bacterium]|nr:hypothetical protein [Bacteroidales bacterium]
MITSGNEGLKGKIVRIKDTLKYEAVKANKRFGLSHFYAPDGVKITFYGSA